ncbi:MAG: hypothetical protein PHS75_08515 [Anaerolineaceae bacterium]|nr:hypothetical protein [Anaerolineaceae bacterium]MDD4578576.1 hypothetical protein [Anaerolineaceae bacterium]
MPNQIGKQLSLDYVECGKLFNYKQKSSEFVPLDRSDNSLANKVFYDIYLPNIGNYAPKNTLRFSSTPGEFGNYSVILQTSRAFPNDLLFIQVQQRTELDYLLRQPGESAPSNLPNRPYTQAHITLIPIRTLLECLQDEIALYESLLFQRDGKLALKDYGIFEANGRSVMPAVLPRTVTAHRLTLEGQDLAIAKGITNLLYQTWLTTDILPPPIVIIAPGLKLELRLAIIQDIQLRLLPILGILTFALDYAIPPESQIYFCEQVPDPMFPLGKSITYMLDDILAVNENQQGFYQATLREGIPRLTNPLAIQYLRKRLPVDDAIVLVDALNSGVVRDDRKLIDSYLRNLNNIESEHTKKLLAVLTQDRTQLLNFLHQIPTYPIQPDDRRTLYQYALLELLKKLPEGTELFLEAYTTVRKQESNSTQFQPYLQYLLETQPKTLDIILNKGQTEIIYDLLDLSSILKVDEDIRARILRQPTQALTEAISQLHKNGKWDENLQRALVSAVADTTTQWNDRDCEDLFTSTPVKIPDLQLQRLVHFLNSENSMAKFSRLPEANKAVNLRSKISFAGELKADLFQLIPKSQNVKLRNLSLSVCNSNSMENFIFTKEWLELIGKTSEISDSEFFADFKVICQNFKTSQPLSLSNPEERALYELLKGRIDPDNGSIEEVFSRNGITQRLVIVLEGMLADKQSIPVKDIEWIISHLPGTEPLALKVISLADESPNFMKILLNLNEASSIQWLSKQYESGCQSEVGKQSVNRLHSILFRIQSASDQYLLDLLTINKCMFVDISNWGAYVKKVERLLSCRPAENRSRPVLAKFQEIVNSTPGLEYTPMQQADYIRELSQLATPTMRPTILPGLSISSVLIKIAELLPNDSPFATSYTSFLFDLASNVPVETLKSWNEYLLYCCWDYLRSHSPGISEANNLYRACESVFPKGLANLE